MTRLPGWERRLHDFIEAARERPFCWETWHCCHLADAAVEAMTGRRIIEEVGAPYAYRSEAHAMAWLRKVSDAGDVPGWLTRVLGDPLPSPMMAQRGDIGAVDGGCAVVIGAKALVLPPEGAPAMVKLSALDAAWRV